MSHAPDDRLGAALHLDLPVHLADVALHRVGGEVRERCDLLVALALRDEREVSDSRSVMPSRCPASG